MALDLARSAALLGMILYHFTFDLALFGYLPPDTAITGVWAAFAKLVAGSFLFLAGGSLWLAHGRGLLWPAFRRRLAMVGGAAALITVATYVAMPQSFIFFGILHSIAMCSVIGLAFLRLPGLLTLGCALGVLLLPQYARFELFNTPWFWWTGLGTIWPPTMDYEPIFPWAAPFLAGLGVARMLDRSGWLPRPAVPGAVQRVLAWPGRHSLAVYLVHQPVLIGLLWLVTQGTGKVP
ncbi:DUF1624 domain-containing protein [Rhodophyticola sp. CCM32]|uniref:DUF1624 domain-containing protein n=1 Tax=Rhodophyticola sp. CCM32 TaxID=2916397 RepID=UPI00107EF37B|nr:heparan-alpha-glucosaminide N-acetyltransferase [Rhodophyticola sp. CCM32]QBX99750.1 DUF1624 domain-containing protein [Rhodophyticola sp. CCM32]